MDTQFLNTFVVVADRGSMAAAARVLNITPAAVAQQIRTLERELGAPLIARAGGVLERASACEASIDLARLSGAGDAAVICSIMRDDGEMARLEDIGDLIAAHGLAVADIGALIERLEGAAA